MPYSIFKKLSLGELRTPRISVQLVNRSIKYPMGILKDVPIKVGSFYVACIIGNISIDRALCDLGSSISLMPYSIFKRLA